MKTKYGIDVNIINGQRYYIPKRKLGSLWFHYEMQGHELKFIDYNKCQEWLTAKSSMSLWKEIKDFCNITIDFGINKFCIFNTFKNTHVRNGVVDVACINYYNFYWYYIIYFLWFEIIIKRPS